MKTQTTNALSTGLRAAVASLLLLGAVANSPAEQTNILTAGDAAGTTSFNAVGHWLYPAAPGPGTNYFTGPYGLRTPTSGTPTFAGDSLTINPGGALTVKVQNNTVTINNLTNSGSIGDAVNPSDNITLAGNMTVVGAAYFSTAGSAAGDLRTITNGMNMFGTGTLTNTDTAGGAGAYPGTVVYKGNSLGYTGPLIVNSNTTVAAYSQTNLGGNPASFNAAQLVLDFGTLTPLASMALTNANSGLTLNPGGGAFNISSGRTLTIANPITGPGGLTNLGAGSLILNTFNAQQNVAGTNTYTGATVVKAGLLLVNGTHTVAAGTTGAYAINSGATLGGNGLIDLSAVNLGVTLASGSKLSPGAAASTAGTLTLNLGTGILDISGAITSSSAAPLLFDLGAINASDQVVLNSGTLNIGSGLLNLGSFNFNFLTGLQPGAYALFQAPAITGTLGTSLTGVVGGYNGALSLSGGNVVLTLTVPAIPIPVFSNLTPSQTNRSGIISSASPIITLTGNVAAVGPTYPPQGESGTVSATIDGVTATGTFTDAMGDFTITFNTTGIPVSSSPYIITYSYAGDGTLGASANNTATTLTMQAPIVLGATDTLGNSSFNAVGNWVLYGTTTPASTAPAPGNTYNTAGFGLRTPSTAGNYSFAGDLLTITSGSALGIKGGSATNTITINNLILSGAINESINPNTIGVIAGNMTVVGTAALNTSAGSGDYRIITNSMVMSGSGTLTNTCASGDYPGMVVYTASNTAFTGPLIVNYDTTVLAGSPANLGGNPASFNAAQLTLDNGTLQAGASFALTNANSGITITPNGGAFDVVAGCILTIDNPITGSGLLTCTDDGTLVLAGNNSGLTGGVSVVNGNTLDLAGALGCGITSDSTSTVEGTGTAAGNLDISGALKAGTATTAGTLTAAGLILENGAVLNGNLASATTVGQGVNSYLQVNGPVVLSGNNIVINPHGTLAVGSTYTLLACTGGISGSFAPVATTPNLEYSFSVTQVASGSSTLIQLTVSAEQNCVLAASDTPGSSSWNTPGNWTCGAAPTIGATYSTAGFELNTPEVSGNQAFAGDLLTVGPGGSVVYEGTGGGDIISANWVLNGGEIGNGGNGYNPTIAGNLTLAGTGAINPGAGGIVTMAATLSGTNLLTNGLGQAGTVIYTGDNATAFTGPLVVNGGTLLQCGSQTNLGGNPANFNAAQMKLDNGIIQVEASFGLSNANSGITITANGGTFDVPNGLILTINNPLAGNGPLTNTDSGELVLNGNNSGFTGGVSVVSGATLDLNGSIGGGMTNDYSSTVEGAGAVAGSVDISGSLFPGAATTAGTLTVGGLVMENGATLNAILGSTTTVGEGVNSFIQVNGNLTLNNNTINLNPQGPLTIGETFTVAACTGVINGSFNPVITLADGGTFSVASVATASNTLVQVTFTSETAYVLTATDAFGDSSWNTAGNWSSGAAPAPGAAYNTANFTLRTPANAGNYSFAGDSLTIASGGGLSIKGGSGNIITINNLTNSGSINNAINPNTIAMVAGNMTVVGAADFNTSGGTETVDFRIITNAMTMSGDGTLTNTCTAGIFPGIVAYTGANTAFTGPLVVNNDTTLQAGSQASLGGNPASFNAAQLTLDNGIFQPIASFAMNNANSGITITPNNGAFDVPAGLTLTIDNPITGTGVLTDTDTGWLVLNSNSSGLTGGLLVVNGATLELNGSVGGGITNDSLSTLEGSGTAAGTLDVAGTLMGGTATTAGTLTASGLVLESGAILGGNLASATTIGQGVNSFLQINGPVVLHNNSMVINPLGTLTAGSTYTLLACTGGLTGSFATEARSANGQVLFSVVSVPSGASTLVQLTVKGAAQPVFTGFSFPSGKLVLSGGNGVPNQPYYLLATTNLAMPGDWVVVATNAFDLNGNFSLTNQVQNGLMQQFFKLQTQ